MLLKVGWSISALEKGGVKRAHIISFLNGALLQELYTRDGSGTLISRDLYDGIRPAIVNDVAGIYDLIEPLVLAGTLIPRPKNVLEKDIDSYYVYTRDRLIVACAQLKRFENGFAEIGCLVVHKDYRSQGRGDAMLGYLERLASQSGYDTVFVLSTQTMEWFIERGFREQTVDALPPSRKAVYNYERKSKIYTKKIDNDRDLDAAELWWNR
jgi:amino-acid N-acetyltransferase